MTQTIINTCFGASLHGEYEGKFWCNAHLHVVTPGEPNKHDIVMDTDYRGYGDLMTLVYPSDSYGFVVIGGSKSGQTLNVAPIDATGYENGHIFTRDEALAAMLPSRARVIRSQRGRYNAFPGFANGIARTYRAPEL